MNIVSCSQCGIDIGQGVTGVSHCHHHPQSAVTLIAAATRAATRHSDDPDAQSQFLIGQLMGLLRAQCAKTEPRRNFGTDYIDMTFGDYELVVGYDYQPAERQTYDDPGCDAFAEVLEVWSNGVDISGLMSDEDLEKLTDMVAEQVEQDRRQSYEDARIDAYESRLADREAA